MSQVNLPQYDHATTGMEVLAGHDLTGKRIVVTGASAGLGAETARLLARAGAQIVMGARDGKAGKALVEEIAGETGVTAQFFPLDLASFASVRAFAEQVGDAPLHVLVNNAGVMATPYGRTEDGFETQIGVNHFGHFLLTMLLMPALLKGAPARVVQLSSSGHIWSDIRWDDMNFEQGAYDPWLAYGQSKTANILFAVELTRRYRERGVVANAVMPGRIMDTALRRYTTEETRGTAPPMGSSTQPTASGLLKTLDQGVATTLWAAVAPELAADGGHYLEDCQIATPWSLERPRRGVKDYALDPAAAKRLWQISEAAIA